MSSRVKMLPSIAKGNNAEKNNTSSGGKCLNKNSNTRWKNKKPRSKTEQLFNLLINK